MPGAERDDAKKAPPASLRRRVIVGRVLAVVLASLSLTQLAAALVGYRNALESPRWPTTSGTVVESRVVGVQRGVRPDVRYVYEVDGRTIEGRNVSYARARGDRSEAHVRSVVERYPVGDEVTVFVRPGSGGIAVLEPGADGYPLVGSVAAAAFWLAAAVLVWLWPVARDPPPRRRSSTTRG